MFVDFACEAEGFSGQVTIQLEASAAPHAVANFVYLLTAHQATSGDNVALQERAAALRHLATTGAAPSSTQVSNGEVAPPLPPALVGSVVTRVVPNERIEFGTSAATSIFGPFFADEDLTGHHDSAGILSMCNAGPNTNASKYFITLVPCPELDGHHEVIGRVVGGLEVIDRIGRVKVQRGQQTPVRSIRISNCGLAPVAALPRGRAQSGDGERKTRRGSDDEQDEATPLLQGDEHGALQERSAPPRKRQRMERSMILSPSAMEQLPSKVFASGTDSDLERAQKSRTRPDPAASCAATLAPAPAASFDILNAQEEVFASDLKDIQETHHSKLLHQHSKDKRHRLAIAKKRQTRRRAY